MIHRMREIGRIGAVGVFIVSLASLNAQAEFKRDLSTDRPDRTESPYTVEQGRFQIEMSFFEATSEQNEKDLVQRTTHSRAIGIINAKLGLTNDLDLQVVSVMASGTTRYTVHRNHSFSNGSISFFEAWPELESGGDLTVRLKYNLLGNDGGPVAIGLMPYLTIPESDFNLFSEQYEFGLIVPFGFDIGKGYGLGAMAEFDITRDWTGGMRLDLVNSVTVSHELFSSIGMYLELFSQLPTQSSPAPVYTMENPSPERSSIDDLDDDWKGTFDLGFTFGIGQNIQLDLGSNIGLSEASEDLTLFSGLSFRL